MKKGRPHTRCDRPSDEAQDWSLVALSLVALPGLAGLRDDFDLGLLRLIFLRDRPTLTAAVVLPALTGPLAAHVRPIVAAALSDRLLVGDLALLVADRLVVGDCSLVLLALLPLLTADLVTNRVVIATRGRSRAGHRQPAQRHDCDTGANHQHPKYLHVDPPCGTMKNHGPRVMKSPRSL